MEMHQAIQPKQSDTTKRFAIVCGLFVCAGILGYAVVAASDGPDTRIIGIGGLLILAFGAATALVFELPVIVAIRFVFIASFFFKGDLSLFKVNEIEDPSGLNLSLTLFTGLILLIYDHVADETREKVFPSGFTLVLVGLFVCAAVSVLYSGPTSLGGFSLLSILTSILITYVTASHFSRRERMIQLVVWIAIGLLFTGLVSISQYTLDFPSNLANFGTGTEEELLGTQSELLSRVPAFLRTPTEMAWVVTSLIPVVLAPLICRAKSILPAQKFLMSIAVLVGVAAVILSLARGSWIALVATLPLMVALAWTKISAHEKKPYLVSVVTAIFLACALLSPFAGKIYDRLTQDDQGSAQIRVPLMETALRMIDDNPLTGVGLNSYRDNMVRYDETAIFASRVFPNPVHNIFAHITAEIGIPGGMLFCLLIIFSLYECIKALGTDDRMLFALAVGLGVGMIAFVISGTKEPGSLGSVRPPIRTCFLLFGSIMALGRICRRQIS